MQLRKIDKVQVVIATKNDVLLLQTNSQRGSFWQNVTGSVDEGESHEQAAKRELFEETGLLEVFKFQKLNFQFDYVHQTRKTQYFEYAFLAFIKKKFRPKLDSNEHQNFKWINIEELKENDYEFKTNYNAFKMAKKAVLCLSH